MAQKTQFSLWAMFQKVYGSFAGKTEDANAVVLETFAFDSPVDTTWDFDSPICATWDFDSPVDTVYDITSD